MITVQEALGLVVANAGRQPVIEEFFKGVLGHVLAEDVFADANSPPFDKSMMDGFAVRAADVNAKRALRVVGEIRAGSQERITIEEGTAAAIMTGAPIPRGADAVVVVERCTVAEGMMSAGVESVKPGTNILARGAEYQRGQVILAAGQVLLPVHTGLLASVGCVTPKVYTQPTSSVLATGDELVPVWSNPPAGRIRDSNTPTLVALLSANGVLAGSHGIVDDHAEQLREEIRRGLDWDLLLLTGGVSMGTADFVPRVLAELGVKQVFHKVAFKPGMPVWFGTHEKGLVFGLPGNPVSVLVCFELFVTTALRARQGWTDPLPRFFNAKLAADFTYPTKRETYHPARLTFTDDGPVVSPVAWFGSADVLGASRSDALAVLPVGPGEHKAGDRLRVLPLSKPGWVWACSGAGGAS